VIVNIDALELSRAIFLGMIVYGVVSAVISGLMLLTAWLLGRRKGE